LFALTGAELAPIVKSLLLIREYKEARGFSTFLLTEQLTGDGVNRILFVCTGNTCRSPMAEAITRARVPAGWRDDLDTRSAGTHALEDQLASALAIDVLREIGIDLSDHRARRLSKSLIDSADLIVVMTDEHKDSVVRIAPGSEAKVLILGELDRERSSPDIEDPIGGGREDYLRTRDELEGLVGFLIEYLYEKFGLDRN
jgi:protein-tyrosine-phosphatase